MALVKIKNPVEYRFQKWIRHYPESTHPTDRGNFLYLVKNICRFNARNWKDASYLESRILKSKPSFNRRRLMELLITFEYLIDFYAHRADSATWSFDSHVKVSNGNYLEVGYKNGEFSEIEKPLPNL